MVVHYDISIGNTIKFHNQLVLFSSKYTSFQQDVGIDITFSEDLTTQEQDDLDTFITNWTDYTTVDQLEVYLDKSVFPFIKTLLNTFTANNISSGITQAGKSGLMLGLFTKKYDVHSNGFPISLKSTFDTGSLYESLSVIQYIRDNSGEYSGLDPFVTDAKLLKLKNDIETFLGVTLST